MDTLDILTHIARDISSALDAQSRYDRLLAALHRAIPYDAAALMRIEDDDLTVIAFRGLTEDALGRRFSRHVHPRLDIICNSSEPFLFPADSAMPDPFDGLLADRATSGQRIHSCLGCPLFVDSRLIGALTADAVDPEAFHGLDSRFLGAVGALAGAELHTADLMRALEISAEKMGLIARDLMTETIKERGHEMIGTGPAMERLRREIDLVARSDFSILVTGETGVGKELVVRAIHAASRRSEQPLLYINCANLTETLAEAELFGHVRGAYTGATIDRIGKFELADGGTLFLDEVGELPLTVQPKLLRALQEGEVQRLGSDQNKIVNVRVLAATNRDLEREVTSGRFRADLFHRLNVYPIRVPPLRERREDITLLAGHFCERAQRRAGTGAIRLENASLSALKSYLWPGNVRELENIIHRAMLKASKGTFQNNSVTIAPRHLDIAPSPAAGDDFAGSDSSPEAPETQEVLPLKTAVDGFRRDYILEAVRRCGGNWASAARELGLHRSNLHKLAIRLGIK